MPVPPGSQLGSYTITSPLGVGGMGEVYRARDTKLQRGVAVKILPDSFALDPDRVARFAREAQVLAALNHPTSRPSMASRISGAADLQTRQSRPSCWSSSTA